jgi:hypothetical protein
VWTFFGLAPEYKVILHDEIFSLCYYSQGGFVHSDVYEMPVHLRRFYLHKLVAVKQEEAKQHEAAMKGSGKSGGKLSRPGVTPRK